jgi:hypothetical protein
VKARRLRCHHRWLHNQKELAQQQQVLQLQQRPFCYDERMKMSSFFSLINGLETMPKSAQSHTLNYSLKVS